MRGSRWCQLALGLVWIGAAAGCRSLPNPPSLLDGGFVPSLTLPPESERAAQAHAWYSTGIHYELADQYAKAYDAYRRAYELDSSNERLVLRMASSLVLQRKTEEALRDVEEFVSRHPSSENALVWLATFYGSTGDHDRVRNLFSQLTRRFPEKPLGWLQLAADAVRQEDAAEAIRILESGLATAQPPTALRQELVRLHFAEMQTARQPDVQAAERQKAIDLLQDIVAETPGDMDSLYALGDLLVRNDQLEDAIRVYEKIGRLQPDDPQVKQRLARTFLAMDDQPKAIAVLQQLADESDTPSNAHYYLAELYLQSGDTANAMSHFRTAADNAPHDPAPWLKLAALEADLGSGDAIATLSKALETMPDNPKILEVMALVRLGQNQYAKAEALLRQAWKSVDPADPDTLPSNLFFYHYAVVCTHLRQTPEAADWLQKAIAQDPDLLELYVQRTMTSTASFRKAATRVLRELAKRPTSQEAAIHAHLATLQLSREKVSSAIREFSQAVAIAEEEPLQAEVLTPRFYFWYGVALDEDGQTDRAVEMFETTIRLDPSYADALNYLAYLWAVRGIRLDEALRHIQTALAIDPGNAAYLDTLGWVYYQQGNYADALDLLRQADQIRPNDPEITGHIEKTLEKIGR